MARRQTPCASHCSCGDVDKMNVSGSPMRTAFESQTSWPDLKFPGLLQTQAPHGVSGGIVNCAVDTLEHTSKETAASDRANGAATTIRNDLANLATPTQPDHSKNAIPRAFPAVLGLKPAPIVVFSIREIFKFVPQGRSISKKWRCRRSLPTTSPAHDASNSIIASFTANSYFCHQPQHRSCQHS